MFKLIPEAPLANLYVLAINCAFAPSHFKIDVTESTLVFRDKDSGPLSSMFSMFGDTDRSEKAIALTELLLPFSTINYHPKNDRLLSGAINEDYVAINADGIFTRTSHTAPYVQVGKWTCGTLHGRQIDYSSMRTPMTLDVNYLALACYGEAARQRGSLAEKKILEWCDAQDGYLIDPWIVTESIKWYADLEDLLGALTSNRIETRVNCATRFAVAIGSYGETDEMRSAMVILMAIVTDSDFIPFQTKQTLDGTVLYNSELHLVGPMLNCNCGGDFGLANQSITLPYVETCLPVIYRNAAEVFHDADDRSHGLQAIARQLSFFNANPSLREVVASQLDAEVYSKANEAIAAHVASKFSK